ncbi:hypothetical protein CHLNCDRAFT_143776 [Chlorella variabilis]|uniref:Uncharacterized protein n=1 Tax=Chlorella variabilis TaxID=554065 RepID=E1ZAE9_CHLVA|nr:hypothetical protein CHLNCDRAFT_143776 [Chlorella variabilis]EFN57050.1 hypothetical protein CHLNCDRAFT_143776 [Chlorella variabilis]|eukprot:XP_005849152.1 hypothetical protein CHLNCDRAFT_143776 [Chlorella variabilis]
MSPQALLPSPGDSPPAQQQAAPQQDQAGGSALELLDSFLAVQRERAAAYRRFDAAFRAYLQNGAEGPYRHVMGQLTAQFQDCSRRVLSVEAALQSTGQDEAAALLRAVQENEREKLRLTLALQALKAAHAQQRFSWQHEEAAVAAAASLAPGVADLLQGHLCRVGCVHEAPTDEPTQAEYAGAVRESYQLLQGTITAISEALEEVQQLQTDLLEQ